MSNEIEERIKTMKLTRAQQQIAEYIVRNPERVGMSSSMEIAKEIGVSDVSVIRFARALGYDGFTAFKSDIYTNMVSKLTQGKRDLSLEERFYVNQKDHDGPISKLEYIKQIQYDVHKTIEQNENKQFDEVVDMLVKAKHRYIAGLRGCIGVAYQTAWFLRFALDHVIDVTDAGTGGIGSLQDISQDDCLIVFSVSRYYKGDANMVKLAHKRKAKICVITDRMLSPFEKLADVILLAETKQLSFFHSTIPLTTIAEYLIARVTQIQSKPYYAKVKERDELTDYLRIK